MEVFNATIFKFVRHSGASHCCLGRNSWSGRAGRSQGSQPWQTAMTNSSEVVPTELWTPCSKSQLQYASSLFDKRHREMLKSLTLGSLLSEWFAPIQGILKGKSAYSWPNRRIKDCTCSNRNISTCLENRAEQASRIVKCQDVHSVKALKAELNTLDPEKMVKKC